MQVDEIAVGFVNALRGAGIDVAVGSSVNYYQALSAVGVEQRSSVYWAGRATLVTEPDDIELYDKIFDAYYGGQQLVATPVMEVTQPITLVVDDDGDDETEGDGDDEDPGDPTLTLRWSRHEVLRDKDFADYDDDELDEAHRLMAAMARIGGTRRSRRRRRTHRTAGHPELRRTVRAAIRSGGEPVRRWYTEPGERLRRVVLLLDISGSMESYARALIRFVHAAVVGRRRVEVFTIGTRLTRITRELSSRDPDRALGAATDAVSDWSGGTRLGDTLAEFNELWGIRGMARGATVVILSDGWDRGSPEVMAEQMARLHRVTHRLVWVNPLKATPGYQPLAQGMAAALPHVDDFIEGHSLQSLDRLAEVLADDRSPADARLMIGAGAE
ncbi:MAG: VWA domain-containing protein [Acidimicrobiia bacterium]|nr:VWA domain-containing protein [Acidimicrobiia bacterium]MYG73038.1 VWA domain-containing protein [Acidimicrobiia bacterium]MYH95091.1 VWA domain-containing protein [Acidimicrobiia bacterium]